MNSYRVPGFSVYEHVDEPLTVPFEIISHYPKILQPWGVIVQRLNENHSVGWVKYHFAAVVERERHGPLQLGEFYIEDLMMARYREQVLRGFYAD